MSILAPTDAGRNTESSAILTLDLSGIVGEITALRVEVRELRIEVSRPAQILVSRREAADMLSVSESKLDELRNAGVIHAVVLDAKPRYRVADLESLTITRRAPAKPPPRHPNAA